MSNADDFNFDSSSVPTPKRKSSGAGGMIWGGLAMIGVIAGGVAFWIATQPVELSLASVANQRVNELETLVVVPKVTAKGLKEGDWIFELVSGPSGAEVDPATGRLTWEPTEEQGPHEYKATLAVMAKNRTKVRAEKAFNITVDEVNQKPTIAEIPPVRGQVGAHVLLLMKAKDDDKPAQKLSYKLIDGPDGATLDPATGKFAWKPGEETEGADVTIRAEVSDGSKGTPTAFAFVINVDELNDPVKRLLKSLGKDGLNVGTLKDAAPDHFTGRAMHFLLDDDPVTVIVYPSVSAAKSEAAKVAPDGKTLFGEPAAWKKKTHFFQRDNLIVLFDGTSDSVLAALRNRLGNPFVVAEPTVEPKPLDVKPLSSDLDILVDGLAKLYEKKDLIGKQDYPGVRKLAADYFEKTKAEALAKAFEVEGASFKKWLDEHTEIKEELYTAIAPDDDLPAVLDLMKKLHAKAPSKLDDYWQLAIATAVTWDQQNAPYDYAHHQRRTHSKLPEGMLGAIENFEYFVDAEKVMQGRSQFLPWEFQIYLINHKTPRDEREWAVGSYLPKRTMFGKCYADVEYDTEMLESQSRVCKLDGHDYTLKNLDQFGGVCAMQADFAARVGKSLGVPAEYVSGEANNGELHAWVMWVELKQVTKTGIQFTLESHGRYFGDKYYVGKLRDPQTGQGITDRQLELRLQAVGLNPVAYRHAKLLMDVYPQLRDKLGWKPTQEIVFLNDIIDLSPGNEEAWRQVAKLARDGKVTTESYRLLTAMFDKLFRTFANFPDFTWTVFDDLVQFQKNDKQRNKYYEKLVGMYEVAGRPDLACEARLVLSDYLLEEGRPKDVINGLAFTVKKFPEEGRYIPKLLDKLEQVCMGVKGADQQLLQFYNEFIPLVPQKRGTRPSKHCMKMLERAIQKFTEAGQVQQAQVFEAQLARLKASGAGS